MGRPAQEVSDDVDDAQILSSAAGNEALALNGAPSKSDELIQYHVGETVTSLQKVSLGPGTAEVLLYPTLMVCVGALLPLTSQEDLPTPILDAETTKKGSPRGPPTRSPSWPPGAPSSSSPPPYKQDSASSGTTSDKSGMT